MKAKRKPSMAELHAMTHPACYEDEGVSLARAHRRNIKLGLTFAEKNRVASKIKRVPTQRKRKVIERKPYTTLAMC